MFSVDILLNRSQQLFASCTAKFADGQQCSIPVFDITHQTPLCEEHAKKMVHGKVAMEKVLQNICKFFFLLDVSLRNSFFHTCAQLPFLLRVLIPVFFRLKDNFLRGDSNRRVQHQQQRKPRKKTKPPALTKKHKKKKRRGPRRPQKPIPPALPQGNLGMPSTSIAMPSQSSIRSAALLVRFKARLLTRRSSACRVSACRTSSKCLFVFNTSPSTPDLSADELPDDITNEIADIPNDLELNQEDFSDVLSRLPDDLQDFDLFEGFYRAFFIIFGLISIILLINVLCV